MYNNRTFSTTQQPISYNQGQNGNPTQLVEPMYHDFPSNDMQAEMCNHRYDGAAPVIPNPGGMMNGPGMMPMPTYTIPQDMIKTMIDQNKKISDYEGQCRHLANVAEVAQKEAAYAKAALEMLKTKPAYLEKKQYLCANTERGDFLELVSCNPNTRKEARTYVSNTVVLDAYWVETSGGELYLALHCRQSDMGKELYIHMPDDIFQKNARLINELAKFNFRLNINASVGRKADLLREYFAEMTKGKIVKEMQIPWGRDCGKWVFTSASKLPWWDRRKKLMILKEKSDKEIAFAMENLKSLFHGAVIDEEKILHMIPYAATLRPLLSEYGGKAPMIFNVVVSSWNPNVIHKLCEITGEKDICSIPTSNKKLSKFILEKEFVCLTRIDSSEMTMQERNLFLQNIRILKEKSEQGMLVVICSDAPVLLNGDNICVLELNENPVQKFSKYTVVKPVYEQYLMKNAHHLAKLIRVNKIPLCLEEYGNIYELFRITELALRELCEEFFHEELEEDSSGWLRGFCECQAQNADRDGVCLQFLDSLKAAVETGIVVVINPYEALTDRAVVVTDDEIYFRKETMHLLLSESLRGYNERCILRELHSHGFLIADEGQKLCFVTRRRCTDCEGGAIYPKCIVLVRNRVIKTGEPDLFLL